MLLVFVLECYDGPPFKMLKHNDPVAICGQDHKNSKVSVMDVKSKNGYANMPAPGQELHCNDQNCDATFSQSIGFVDSVNEKCGAKNGIIMDESFYESGVGSSNFSDHGDVATSINSLREATQDSKLTGKITSLDAGLNVFKRKRVTSALATDETKIDLSYSNLTKSSVTKMHASSEIFSHGSRDLDEDSTLEDKKSLKNFPEGIMMIDNMDQTESKNIKGQKAKKSLFTQFSFRGDARVETNEQCSDISKSFLSVSSSEKVNYKDHTSADFNQVKSSIGTLAGMTIKVNVLENALGLSTKSFSQLDAKTFDRIVLSVFQHKGLGQARKSSIGARTSAKFGSTSRHANRRIGSAFMAEPLHPPPKSIMQNQLLPNSSPISSHSDEGIVKRPGFLAKKTSIPLQAAPFKRMDNLGSDSESRSPILYAQDSSIKPFVQKARKSSHSPWSHKYSFGNSEKGPMPNVSQIINSGKDSFLNVNLDKSDCFIEKTCVQTRQSLKRKWDSIDNEDITCLERTKEKKIKSEFLVPMSGSRYCREGGHYYSSLEMNIENVSNTRFSNQQEIFEVVDEIASWDPFYLCCCFLPGIENPLITKCEAVDSFDGKTLGCSRRVTNFEMLRPSVGVPFRAFCDDHRKKLKEHQCCPGCGLFCTQGNFFECKVENRQEIPTGDKSFDDSLSIYYPRASIHRFHKHCQVFSADNKCYCPHCFSESFQLEGMVYNNKPRSATFVIHPELHIASQNGSDQASSLRSSGSARLCMPKKDMRGKNGSICSDSLKSFQSNISEDKFKGSVNTQGLLESINCDSSKWKKVRPCPKSLCLACKCGDIGKVLYILGEGVDPNLKPDDIAQPAIHLASKYNHKDIVEILLSAGVSADSLDHELHTPLMEAAQNGCVSVIELLIKAGCSVNARAHDGMTALHLAAKSGRKEVMDLLLKTGKIDINTQDDGGWTALIWATEHGHKDCIAFLLGLGADPNLKDNELNTSLHWAAFTGNEDIVIIFLDAGCFIDDVNDHGDTPIHIAARQDHFKCVEVLLWRWADITIANKAGLTPLQCCVEEKCKSAHHLKLVNQLPSRPKEKIISRDISRGRESCPIMVVNSFDSEDMPPDFSYILGYVETSPINVNRLVTSLQICNCSDNCLSSSSCSCCRSSVKRWYDENGRLSSNFNFSEPPLIFECNIMCSCKTSCLNRVVQLGTINNLQVFRTNGRGWGCRTLRDIAKGTFVCEYAGELITDEEANRREDDSYLFDLDFQDSDTYCIDAARYGNVSRFINHLCEPNVIPVKVFVDHQDLRFPRICFFASKDIKAFDELGFDYGYKFWSIKWKFFTCTCGSQNCKYSKDTILKTIEEYNKLHVDEVEEE